MARRPPEKRIRTEFAWMVFLRCSQDEGETISIEIDHVPGMSHWKIQASTSGREAGGVKSSGPQVCNQFGVNGNTEGMFARQ